MRSLLILLAATASLLALTQPRRVRTDRLDDPHVDARSLLAGANGVARVERLVSVPNPTCRIIHVADYHAVSRDDLAADLRDQDGARLDSAHP